jgi:hypothetical protein
LDEFVHRYGLPHTSSQNWVPTSTTTSFGSTVRTVGSTFGTSQSPIPSPTRWYSTPSRNYCTKQLTPKGASGSRNYLTHYGGFELNLQSRQCSHPTS